MSVKVRFPPSPTGYCHVGTARMAIVNYMFARKHGGTIYFRSEDTDKERSKREYEDDIKEQLEWLGLSWDDFSRSTEFVSRHTAAMQKLIDEDKAYVSEEPSKNDPSRTVHVVRLCNPGKVVTFSDVIRGDITFDTTELKDFVVGRAIDDPLYNFAVVVDDAAQGITHVIRGEDHISNTPRQIMIQEALGYPRPVYAHYPLHLGVDKSKLSKRTGDVAIRDYREKGYLSEALLNYLAVLGWTPPSQREILSLQEMIEEFDIRDLHKSGAVFDVEKLRWYNRQYLLKETDSEFANTTLRVLEASIAQRNIPYNATIGERLLPILKERISVAEDIRKAAVEGEYDYYFVPPSLEKEKIPQKGGSAEAAAQHLHAISRMFVNAGLEEFGTPDRIRHIVWDYATREGRGEVLWPLRFALSGREKSPDPFIIATIIGKDATVQRVESARKLLL